MKTVAVYEAKNRLSEILAAVEHGEEYTVTRHGTPVARIVPAHAAASGSSADELKARRKLIARIKARREANSVTDFDYRAAVEEGRD